MTATLGHSAANAGDVSWFGCSVGRAVAYSPFGHGDFPGPQTREGRVLQEIADAHHATPRQVALRFLVRFPLTFAIPKASKPAHVVENAGQPELRLTADDISRIDQAFPRGPRPRELPML